MKSDQKAANAKAWAMLKKLEALAERGVDGERLAAQHKLERLKARLNFSEPLPGGNSGLVSGDLQAFQQGEVVLFVAG